MLFFLKFYEFLYMLFLIASLELKIVFNVFLKVFCIVFKINSHKRLVAYNLVLRILKFHRISQG